MSKSKTFFILALLLCFTLSSAARTGPKQEAKPEEKVEGAQVEENCEGIGEEECMMRRTLVAHLDYIYTQNHKP